jgi:hypothetical protein
LTGPYIVGDGKIFDHFMDRRTRAIDLMTGKVVWTSEPMDYPWGVFTAYTASYSWGPQGGGGNIYMCSYDGHLYAYDIENGELNWRAFTENTTETGPGNYITWSQAIIADGKVYFSVGEHSPPSPLPRGGKLYCVDATTGELLWSFEGNGFYATSRQINMGGISSGILWYPNHIDGCLWAFGMGETATTVSASPKIIANGANVLIEGSVTDQTPSIKGTPAVSDESMGAWMEYLYANKPMPTNVTGVSVALVAIASNGTVTDIAHATTDSSGQFSYLWTPPAQDTYTILANFEGSLSYYSSWGETAVGVTASPEAPTVEPTEEPAYTTIDLAIIAAVVVVAILVLYTLWTVRKLRK